MLNTIFTQKKVLDGRHNLIKIRKTENPLNGMGKNINILEYKSVLVLFVFFRFSLKFSCNCRKYLHVHQL